jgi:hypothetical protein
MNGGTVITRTRLESLRALQQRILDEVDPTILELPVEDLGPFVRHMSVAKKQKQPTLGSFASIPVETIISKHRLSPDSLERMLNAVAIIAREAMKDAALRIVGHGNGSVTISPIGMDGTDLTRERSELLRSALESAADSRDPIDLEVEGARIHRSAKTPLLIAMGPSVLALAPTAIRALASTMGVAMTASIDATISASAWKAEIPRTQAIPFPDMPKVLIPHDDGIPHAPPPTSTTPPPFATPLPPSAPPEGWRPPSRLERDRPGHHEWRRGTNMPGIETRSWKAPEQGLLRMIDALSPRTSNALWMLFDVMSTRTWTGFEWVDDKDGKGVWRMTSRWANPSERRTMSAKAMSSLEALGAVQGDGGLRYASTFGEDLWRAALRAGAGGTASRAIRLSGGIECPRGYDSIDLSQLKELETAVIQFHRTGPPTLIPYDPKPDVGYPKPTPQSVRDRLAAAGVSEPDAADWVIRIGDALHPYADIEYGGSIMIALYGQTVAAEREAPRMCDRSYATVLRKPPKQKDAVKRRYRAILADHHWTAGTLHPHVDPPADWRSDPKLYTSMDRKDRNERFRAESVEIVNGEVRPRSQRASSAVLGFHAAPAGADLRAIAASDLGLHAWTNSMYALEMSSPGDVIWTIRMDRDAIGVGISKRMIKGYTLHLVKSPDAILNLTPGTVISAEDHAALIALLTEKKTSERRERMTRAGLTS